MVLPVLPLVFASGIVADRLISRQQQRRKRRREEKEQQHQEQQQHQLQKQHVGKDLTTGHRKHGAKGDLAAALDAASLADHQRPTPAIAPQGQQDAVTPPAPTSVPPGGTAVPREVPPAVLQYAAAADVSTPAQPAPGPLAVACAREAVQQQQRKLQQQVSQLHSEIVAVEEEAPLVQQQQLRGTREESAGGQGAKAVEGGHVPAVPTRRGRGRRVLQLAASPFVVATAPVWLPVRAVARRVRRRGRGGEGGAGAEEGAGGEEEDEWQEDEAGDSGPHAKQPRLEADRQQQEGHKAQHVTPSKHVGPAPAGAAAAAAAAAAPSPAAAGPGTPPLLATHPLAPSPPSSPTATAAAPPSRGEQETAVQHGAAAVPPDAASLSYPRHRWYVTAHDLAFFRLRAEQDVPLEEGAAGPWTHMMDK